jgi:hypothetical protein
VKNMNLFLVLRFNHFIRKKIQNNKFTSLLNFIKRTQDIMLQSLIKVTNQSDPSKVKTLDEPHSW